MAKVGKRSRDTELEQTHPKRSKPSKILEDTPDSEEDPGRSISKQFLVAAKETAKHSNVAVVSFTNTVDERKQRLNKFLDGLAFKVTEQDNQLQELFLNTLTEVYVTHLPKSTTTERLRHDHGTGTKPAECTVYNIAKSSIMSSRELLGHYDRICQQTAAAEGVLRMESGSEGDLQTLQKVLYNQGEKTKVEVDYFLNGSSNSVTEKQGIHASGADSDLWTRFAMPSKEEDGKVGKDNGESWAVAAKHIETGVQRIVKYLPDSE